MTVTLVLVIIIVLTAYFLYKPLHKYRYPIYIVNTILALALGHEQANYITLGFIALSFFIVVMYTGVLEKGTLRKRLSMVRAELAVLGTIYLVPHFLAYTELVLEDIGLVNANLAYFLGLIAGVVIAPLAITSLMFIRKKMTYKQWKSLHQLAYFAYLIIFIHLIVQQTDRMWFYIIIFGVYGVLRTHMELEKKWFAKKPKKDVA